MRIPILRPSLLLLALIVLIAPSAAGAASPARADAPPTAVELRIHDFLETHGEFRLESHELRRLVRFLDAAAADRNGQAAPALTDRQIVLAIGAIGVRDSRSEGNRSRPSRARRPSERPRSAASLGGGCVPPLAGSGLGAGSGSISGTITEEGTGTPIEGVEITFRTTGGNFVTLACSASDGGYVSDAVFATGTYTAVTYEAPGHLDELWDDLPCTFGDCDPMQGTAIAVTDGVMTSGIDFALAAGGSISGTILESGTETPIEGTFVDVFDSGGNSAGSAVTAPDGTYVTDSRLPAGSYYVRVFDYTGHVDEIYDDQTCVPDCNPTGGTPIAVAAGTPTTGIDFVLDAGGEISGTVTDADGGAPITGVELQFFDANGVFVDYAPSDGSGVYSTSIGLPTGTYFGRTETYNSLYVDELWDDVPCAFGQCDPTTGTGIAVTVGATTSGVDFELDLGGVIAGQVTEAVGGSPITFREVDFFTSAGDYVGYGYTDVNGDYVSTRGLPTGTYYAKTAVYYVYVDELFDDIACPGDSCDVTTGGGIGVTLGATTGSIDFALDLGAGIYGTITEAAGGTPLNDVRVRVFLADGTLVDDQWSQGAGVWTTEIGLPAGTYYARTDNESGYLDRLYDGQSCGLGCDPTTGSGIVVALATPTGGVDFALAPGGAIAGTVTDATSTLPVMYPGVDVYDADGEFLTDAYGLPDGTYQTLKGLPTGTYYVVLDWAYPYRSVLYGELPCPFGDCPVLGGTEVVVASPSTTGGIDFALAPPLLAGDGFESGGFGGWFGGSGAAPLCAHSMCARGHRLDPVCDPCVAAVVAEHPYCALEHWGSDCIRATWEICGIDSCEWIDWDD